MSQDDLAGDSASAESEAAEYVAFSPSAVEGATGGHSDVQQYH